MVFWIRMLVMDLLIPLTMICFGNLFIKKPPKTINAIFGYRTSMSCKNQDTWNFAHKYCGKLWFVCGLVFVQITAVAMLCVIGMNKDIIGTIGTIIAIVELIPLIGVIIPTEVALHKNFDKDGNRRNEG